MQRLFVLLLLLFIGARPGWGPLPESGRPVPALADFGDEVRGFMDGNVSRP